MTQTDCCITFYLQNILVRGHFCRVDKSITKALSRHNYPQRINELLAEMVAVSSCFIADVKSDCHATMQLTGDGLVKLAVVDLQNSNNFRCCATFDNEKNLDMGNLFSIPELFGENRKLVFTIDFENQRYQTIISLNHSTLSECFQHYFDQSEQLESFVLVKSSTDKCCTSAAALILQRIPTKSDEITHDNENDHWNEIKLLTSTIKPNELLSTGPQMKKLIDLVYRDLSPVVSRETEKKFNCNCSSEKISKILRQLDTTTSKINDKHAIKCEYCGKEYSSDNL